MIRYLSSIIIPAFCALFAVAALESLAAQAASSVTIRGTIRNGTNESPQQVEELRLIRLKDGMQVVQIINDAGPDFAFEAVPGDAPLLIRASYGGTAYTKMVPPAPRFQKQAQELLVFEPGAQREDIHITPLIQLLNAKDGLRVSKVYAIENSSTPPRSYRGDPLVYIPSGAKEVQTQLRNPGSQMPIPLTLQAEGDFHRSGRGFRPGRSLLTVDFLIPSRDFTDRVPVAEDGTDESRRFSILLWRPEAAEPQITGGEKKRIEIPDEGAAYQLQYPATGEVRISMDDRNIYFENPMAEHENAFLNHPGRTILALVVAMTAFFFFISLIATVFRRETNAQET